MQKVCNDQLGDWFERYPGEAKAIVNKAIQAQRARVAARQAQDRTRKSAMGGLRTAGQAGRLPKSGDPTICEIYVVEGDLGGRLSQRRP